MLCGAWCVLFVVRCLLLGVARCSLFVVCGVLYVARCLLCVDMYFVVRCLRLLLNV